MHTLLSCTGHLAARIVNLIRETQRLAALVPPPPPPPLSSSELPPAPPPSSSATPVPIPSTTTTTTSFNKHHSDAQYYQPPPPPPPQPSPPPLPPSSAQNYKRPTTDNVAVTSNQQYNPFQYDDANTLSSIPRFTATLDPVGATTPTQPPIALVASTDPAPPAYNQQPATLPPLNRPPPLLDVTTALPVQPAAPLAPIKPKPRPPVAEIDSDAPDTSNILPAIRLVGKPTVAGMPHDQIEHYLQGIKYHRLSKGAGYWYIDFYTLDARYVHCLMC
jgi:hypothetical protein